LCCLKSLEFYKGKRVLLLQGPRGPFFWRLAEDLKRAGATVYKINFNGGDLLFYPLGAVNYRGKPEEWRAFLERFLEEKDIDVVLLFSEKRFYHRVAVELCKEKKVMVGIFEEGYVRPDYVTLDACGVNGSSLIAQAARKGVTPYELPLPESYEPEPPKRVGNAFWHEVLWAVLYYLGANALRPLFPHYRHHISLYFPESLFKEALPWLSVLFKKPYQSFKERKIRQRVYGELKSKYYLVPLQVHNDSQILYYSPFKDVKEFIELVVRSFARYAPKETFLVFKHHPRDRAYRDYGSFISELTRSLGVEDRVLYLHDAHLPTLIDNSIGVVVVNSSVGLQALDHGKPTAVLGDAVYKFKGVVWDGPLDAFWEGAKAFKIDERAFRRLRRFIILFSQINGSLHKRVLSESATGLRWEKVKPISCLRIFKKLEETVACCRG